MKYRFVCFFILLSACGTTKRELKNINTEAEAFQFIRNNPQRAQILTFSSDAPNSPLAKLFLSKKQGAIVKHDSSIYKVIQVKTITELSASYVFLNGYQLSTDSINALRKNIMAEYYGGTPLLDLVKRYGMDGNKTGELHWTTGGTIEKAFEDAVLSHTKGDLFTVDIPANEWYYVVLKTADNKKTEIREVLRVLKSM
jgi:hypothetical protein